MNQTQAVINYTLNKFCPFLIIGFLVFSKFTFETWEPYAIMVLLLFVDRFSFKTGYSVAFCEKNNLIPFNKEDE